MVRGKKLIAMILVFTMTFSYFSVVTESIAATNFVSLFGGGADTGNSNVEFDAFLSNQSETSKSMVSDVNDDNVSIRFDLDVKDSGYLKNGKVEIKSDDELNFAIKEDNTVAELSSVQSLENNTVELNKIDNSMDKMEVSIPIKYDMEEYVNESKMNNTTKVILSGTYVDDNGKENDISKEVELNLAWKDNRAVKVESQVSKYIQFGNGGVILQSVVKVDSTNENKNSLPVKSTELNIDVPTLNNVKPSEVTVVANSTAGTNGEGVGETQFNNDNWEYNADESKLSVKVENSKKLVEINNDEYLKLEGEEPKKEERYYSVAGIDEFLITYTFQNVDILDEMEVASKVEAKVTTFSGVSSENMENVATAENDGKAILTGQTGNIVSYNVENETKEVSKVYAYLSNETNYDSKTAINISYKDIVEEIILQDTNNYYLDKANNKVETDDIYYKQVSVNKDNFNEILGEDGKIEILDVDGNSLATINKDLQADDNGNYVINFQNKVSKITLKLSAPINEGNLIVSNKKAVSNISISKSEYANMEYLVTGTIQKAKFNYVSDLVDLGNCEIKTKLNETKTNFNLVIDRDSLSTVTPNTNVEMRLELNNDEETSDIYGNSVFELEMPEYVTGLNLTNASMIYGEGLDISNVETYQKDGKSIIKVSVDGKQENLNSGVLTNGANIVLNADLTVDKYTPSVGTEIKAYCYNSEATNYNNPVEYSLNDSTVCDYEEAKVEYSAPNGVVAINTVGNYADNGATITSIKQGTKVDYIDIYSEAKNATMEVVVVNNNDNSVKDLSILGRIPFKGVKDIATGKDLGTTIDTKLVNGIVSAEEGFTIYYSENAEATKDLQDSNNNWTSNPESFDNIKSYLIVPDDSNYILESKQVLKFNYQYEIPAELDHNEEVYGTFLAYYTDEQTAEETAKPDLVGLTTGAGPELNLETKTDAKELKELQEFETTVTVKNTGEDLVNDVVVTVPVPKNTTFVSAEIEKDGLEATFSDGNVISNIGQLEKDEELKIVLKLKVNALDNDDTDKIVVSSMVTAKDLAKELKSEANEISIIRSELRLTQTMDFEYPNDYFRKDDKLRFVLVAKNLTSTKQNDVVVETQLPKELNFEEAFMYDGKVETGIEKVKNATYDSSTNKVTWKIDAINENEAKTLNLTLTVGDLDSGMTEKNVKIQSKISAKETETYNAEDIEVYLGKNSFSITQTSETPTYVKEGEVINYSFAIKNESPINAQDIVLTDIIPEGIVVKNMSYTANGIQSTTKMSETGNAEVTLTLPANSETEVNVEALASNLNGVQEKTVTNSGKISGKNVQETSSNSVTHIIQASDAKQTETSGNSEVLNPSNNGDITKSYKISGTAWLDENSNGMRDDNEKKMSGVTAMLVDSTSGTIKANTTTNDNGEYVFSGLQNGSYLVLFRYDTKLYTTTTYKKEGIESNINSDVVTTKIEQDGKKENGAVTDVISLNGASVANIDIGLIESAQFSLGLDKSITKVTVQNSQGTKTEQFDKTKLAKYDISAKYLSGTTVYVEYTLTVTNNGDLTGFASELVDYIPEGMTFNSNLNPDWYTGTDGRLYTKVLTDTELTKGENKEIKLVLTKQMTAENTKLVSNTAEVAEDYNIYGVSDINSTPNNQAQGEDDISTADIILTVSTGESLVYISAIIISTMIGCAVAFIVYEKVIKNKRKGGV